MKITKGLFTSDSNEWETPQYVFNELNKEFNFDIDVCATEGNAKCFNYFTKRQDGLKQNWWGFKSAFMNPPYGKEIGKWMEKAYKESEKGLTAICLIPARTDTGWWHNWVVKAQEVRFIKGRLKFGKGKQSAPFPSCIAIFRPFYEGNNIYNVPLMNTVVFKNQNEKK